MRHGAAYAAVFATIFAGIPTSAWADTFTWDPAADQSGSGGDGDWDTTTPAWTDGISDFAWDNAAKDFARFAGAPGTVTLTEPITVGGVTFDVGDYIITGDNLTLSPPTGVTSPVLRVSNLGDRAIVSSLIEGSAGFVKTGDGSLVLNNSSNTFTGDLVINGGSLVVTSQDNLGLGTTTISVNGLASTGNPGYSGGQLVVQGGLAGATITRGISVAGRGPGAVNGSAGLVSVGNNTFTGNLVVGSTSSEGRVLATHGITQLAGNVQLATGAPSIFYGNGNWIVSGQVTGTDFASADRFIKTGNLIGTTLWLQNPTNNFAQTLRIDSGTVRVSTNSALGNNSTLRSVDLLGGFLEIHTDTPDFTTRNIYGRGTTAGIFVDRALGGSGLNETVVFGKTAADNATFTINGRNGYNVTLNGSLGPGTTLSWAGGANLTFNNNSSGTFTFDGNIAKNEATNARSLIFGGNGDSVLTGSLNQLNTGVDSLVKNSNGTLTLNYTGAAPVQPFLGTTTITGGTLAFSSATALPTGTINLGNATTAAGTLTYLGAGETLSNAIVLNTTTANAYLNANGAGALILNGAITGFVGVGGNKTLVLGGESTAANEIQSVITNNTGAFNNSLAKIGSGTWVLTGANLYGGSTTIAGGTLRIQDTFSGSSRDVVPDASAIIFSAEGLAPLTNRQLAGGVFEYVGANDSASVESVGALTPTAGAANVIVTPTGGLGTAELTFASLAARGPGATLNLAPAVGGAIKFTAATTDVNGLIGGYATFNGTDWAAAVAADDTASAFTGYTLLTNDSDGDTFNFAFNSGTVTLDGPASVNSLKIVGTALGTTVNLGGQLTNTTGGILFDNSAGTGTIDAGTLGAPASEVIVITAGSTPANALMINSLISGTTGQLTKSGSGTLIVGGANAFTGSVHINEGTLQLSGATARIGATQVAATALNLRQNATLDLNGAGPTALLYTGGPSPASVIIGALNGAGLITNSGGGANTPSALVIGNLTTTTAAGTFTGILQDGAGPLSVVKRGTGVQSLTGANTYTGTTVISNGTLAVTSLANIGQASGIGAGDDTDAASNAASLVFNGGTLTYTGATAAIFQSTATPSVSIDRLFTLAGNGVISSEGSFGFNALGRAANHAALIFNNTAPVSFSGAGARTLTLTGDSLGDNQIDLQLINNTNANEALSITKSGAGLWILGNTGNSYTGNTSINGGVLRVGDDGSALTRTLPTTSALVLGLTTGSGVIQTSGTFDRPVTTPATPGSVTFGGTTGGGGFAASTDRLIVNLGGGQALQWGAGGFVGTGGTQTLFLNSSTSWADVVFQNDIDLNVPTGTVQRTIQIDDNGNTGLDFATITGGISNSGAGIGGLNLTGGGTLILGDNNTYNGNTQILSSGAVIVSSIGNATGTTASSLGASGGTLQFNGNTTQQLLYVGPGETASRPISFITALSAARTYRIDSSGSGALVLTDLTNNKTGNFALNFELRGNNTDGNMITSVLGNGGGTGGLNVSKFDGGYWILNPTAPNTFTGVLTAGSGTLGLTADGIGAASQLNFSNAAILAHGGPLTFSTPVQLNNNTTAVFAGTNDITINGNVTKQAGANDQTISNNLESGAILTVNGNFVNAQTATATRTIFNRGYGSTVWNGLIQNNSATSQTRFDIRIADGASFTLGGDNKGAALGLTGGILLGQGTLIVGHAGGLGPAANNVILSGGVFTSTVDLTGAD